MARTQKKAKAVTVVTVEVADAANTEARSIGETAADVVAVLPVPGTVAEAVEIIASGAELFIPLDKLKKSPRNARKTPHSDASWRDQPEADAGL